MITLSHIVATLGGTLRGQDCNIHSAAALSLAHEGQISFVTGRRHLQVASGSRASALIVDEKSAAALSDANALIIVSHPQYYFAQVLNLLHPPAAAVTGIHPGAVIADDAVIGKCVQIDAHVVIGARSQIADGCRILAGSVIGEDCIIGENSIIWPHVSIYANSVIGSGVQIHSGSVIGADGFGNVWHEQRWHKIPQIGRVIIGDDVEIGANTTIDRGALGDTVIENGVKIDNLVQIAHNVHIGAHTAIAACVGIAGSTRIGVACQIGGAAMIVGHIHIADRTIIGGGTLVSGSIDRPDYYASSYPLQTHKDWVRNAVHLRHLNALHRRVKALENPTESTKEAS